MGGDGRREKRETETTERGNGRREKGTERDGRERMGGDGRREKRLIERDYEGREWNGMVEETKGELKEITERENERERKKKKRGIERDYEER